MTDIGPFNFDGTGAAEGATVTATSAGGTTQITPGTGGSITHAGAMAYNGLYGGRFANAASTLCFMRTTYPTASFGTAFHGILTTPPATDATGNPWVHVNRYSSGAYRLGMTLSTRKMFFLDNSASSGQPFGYIKAAGGSTDLVLAASTQYRIEIQALTNASTGTTAGQLDIQIYPVTGSTTTALNNTTEGSSHITTANLGLTTVLTGDVGVVSTGDAGLHVIGWDEVILRDTNTVIGSPTVTLIDLIKAGVTSTTTGTQTGGGTLTTALSDTSSATIVTSGDNPASQVLVDTTLANIVKPSGNLTTTWDGQALNVTTAATCIARLYAPGSTTLLATSQPGTPPSSYGSFNVTFLAADISAITTTQFASGLRITLTATAS